MQLYKIFGFIVFFATTQIAECCQTIAIKYKLVFRILTMSTLKSLLIDQSWCSNNSLWLFLCSGGAF